MLDILRSRYPALLALLRNGTARLEGDMLAALASRAEAIPWLTEALTARPGLPAPLLHAMLPQLTREALQRLLQRHDLPAATLAALKERANPKPALVWGG